MNKSGIQKKMKQCQMSIWINQNNFFNTAVCTMTDDKSVIAINREKIGKQIDPK